ncbi:hypothetical protein GZH46_00480 [Fragariocoptes setiger]|uniref:Uncharacterized protein n=1 Tax=Fragariocoptes setiger TaxID=1670756 RepID=A0ABQ7SC54_9ACAR|nr:hypothetical protein GZH46_00480 [Fragariocoptes setiger]
MKTSYFIFALVLSLSILARHAYAGVHDELAKKFVKLLIAAALLSPPVPVRINVNHEPIIGPPIPHPWTHGIHHGGFGGGFGGHGIGRR